MCWRKQSVNKHRLIIGIFKDIEKSEVLTDKYEKVSYLGYEDNAILPDWNF